MKHLLLSVLAGSLVGVMIPNAVADNVPEWIKNNAGWWATNQIDDDSFVSEYNFIKTFIDENKLNVSIKPRLNRQDLLGYFTKVSALIYPSVFEAYGLPLIEAQKINLPIIASELDYVRDLIDPNESFAPHSPRSISRSVKRFLAIKEVRPPILTSEQLLKEIL